MVAAFSVPMEIQWGKQTSEGSTSESRTETEKDMMRAQKGMCNPGVSGRHPKRDGELGIRILMLFARTSVMRSQKLTPVENRGVCH